MSYQINDNSYLKNLKVLIAVGIMLFAGATRAEWSGVSLSLGETESLWEFSNFETDVELTEIFFRVENKTSTGLRAGFAFGQTDLSLDPPGPTEVLNYGANFLNFDLGWLYEFDYGLSVETAIGWRYYSGSGTNDDITADVGWTHGWLGVSPGVELGTVRLAPYWQAHRLDGDLGIDGVQRSFSRKETFSTGLNIDYLADETSFVRLNLGAGGDEGFLIEFIRRN